MGALKNKDFLIMKSDFFGRRSKKQGNTLCITADFSEVCWKKVQNIFGNRLFQHSLYRRRRVMETSIKEIGFTKLTNAEHLNFHTEVKMYVEKCGMENISCANEFPLYQVAIDKEASIINRQSASAITAGLDAKDIERDDLLSYLFISVSNAKNSPVPAHKEAHHHLSLVLEPFLGIAYETNSRESGQIISLLKELSEASLEQYISDLGLANVIELIETTNNEYLELDQQRTADVPSKRETNELRATIDDMYRKIKAKTEGTVLLMTNESAEKLVVNLNNLIDTTNTAYNQRTAPRSSTDKK